MPFLTTDDGTQIFYKRLGERRVARAAQPRLAAQLRRVGGRRALPRRAGASRHRARSPRSRAVRPELGRQRDGHVRRRPGVPDRAPRPHRADARRALHRRRRDRPLPRPARVEPGGEAGPGLGGAAADAAAPTTTRAVFRSRCSTASARAKPPIARSCTATSPTARSSATTAPAMCRRARATRSGCRGSPRARATRTSASRRSRRPTSAATSAKIDVPDARDPRRRRPDRAVRDQRAAARRSSSPTRASIVYEGGAHGLPDTARDRLHADLLAFIDA